MNGRIVPRKVRLEATSVCQLRCPACPTATRVIAPVIGPGYLAKEDFDRFIDGHRFVRHVELSNFGELFLNPDLADILEIAYRRGVALSADNGANMNRAPDELLEALVRFRFRSMAVSIDGASREVYTRYRVGGDFDRVIRNIRTVNRFKEKYRSPFPRLAWQFIVFDHNAHEFERARALASGLGMEFRPKLPWNESKVSASMEPLRSSLPGGFLSRTEFASGRGRHYSGALCHHLWHEPQVNWDGSVLGCCVNYWGDFGGNVFEDGLLACVNGEGMKHARAMLRGKAPARKDIPCSACDVYRFMAERKSWIGPCEILRARFAALWAGRNP